VQPRLVPPDTTPPLTRATKLWYGFGQMAEGLSHESFSLFLLFYYTQVVGLSGALSGQAILIALLFDAVTDPMAGVLSDRLESRWGRRHPFMYAAALPMAATFYLVFAPPAGLGQTGLFLWLTAFAVLGRLSLTLFHVPHLALGAELSTDYEERTRIVMFRTVFSRIGHGTAGLVGLLIFMRPTAEFKDGQLNPAAYPPYAATLAIAIFAVILLSAWRTQSRVPYLAKPDAWTTRSGLWGSMLSSGLEALRNRSFRALFLGSTISFVTWGITGALGLHLGTYFWQATTHELVVWGVCAATGIYIGLFFWASAAARFDKKPVFILGLTIFTVFTAAPTFLKLLGWWPAWGSPAYIPAFVLTTGLIAHFGIASTMVTGGSMMADVTDEDALMHGRRREGIFFGAVSFAAKASFGIGSQIAGFVVDFVGLVPGATPEEVGPQVVRDLGLTLGFSILGLVGLSLAVFSRYDLTRERHAGVRAELDALRGIAERSSGKNSALD
jgi:Na+/melibiose symporter-like transporter